MRRSLFSKRSVALSCCNCVIPRRRLPPKNEVPLAWSSAFTLADLMEVIVALHTLGAVRKPNGTPVTFKDLVRAFERFLNVSILNPDRCRYTTINRKLHLTKFLDTMREALVELSQR